MSGRTGELWKPQSVSLQMCVCACMCLCVWADPKLYGMALWDNYDFTVESTLIGGNECAEELQGDCKGPVVEVSVKRNKARQHGQNIKHAVW